MDRRRFLAAAGAAVLAPTLPAVSPPVIGLDLASGPDEMVIRMLWVQKGLIREVHRVTGIPRYQMGHNGVERDTWMEQVDAGASTIIIGEQGQ